jgi:hypothetical protein
VETATTQAPPKAPFLGAALGWGILGSLAHWRFSPATLPQFLGLWAASCADFFLWWGAVDHFRIFLSGNNSFQIRVQLLFSGFLKVVSLIVLIKLIWLWRNLPGMTLLSATLTLVIVPLVGGAFYAWRRV